MVKDDFFYLGKILKTYGSKGHLLIFLDVDDPVRYEKMETVFIGIENDRIPFSIEEFELKQKNSARIRFEDICTADDAGIFIGRELYLPVDMLPPLKGKRFYYHEVIGFTVFDKKYGNIGIITSILDLPQQSLMQIQHGSKEILIPIVDKVLLKVDRSKKELHIWAPEGLIEIYI
jgi:16S rRNA processing protein RimM